MLKQIVKEQQNVEIIVEALNVLCSALEQKSLQTSILLESQANLKSTIKRILITNKEIPSNLATTIAKTIIYSKLIEELIERKKRYKKYVSLRKVYDYLTDVAASKLSPATTEEIDNVSFDIVNLAHDIIKSIHGKQDLVNDIQQTFEVLLNRLMTTTTERNRVNIMKLASKIVQSNNDVEKRREIISQYVS